ncbi:hypothetical protein [Sphingobacterium sp.]|uniref:hypothetical protein n=1 Tax=Sphingobacterium sp. TaxID=341027 RepID=UPI0028A0859C|nr:hypothetical protein [Sphingobacterium sp.]
MAGHKEYSSQSLNQSEIALLKAGINRTYKERFEMTTRLYKIQQTLKKAKIVHKSFNQK